MRVLAIILLAGLLISCAPGYSKQYTGPNGRSAYYVDCLDRQENCYPTAGSLCPGGYRITKLESGLTLALRGGVRLTDNYDMLIECNE